VSAPDTLALASAALRGIADLLDTMGRPADAELTPAQVAAELRTSVSFVREQIREGALRARRLGPRFWRVSRADLDAFKRARTATRRRSA
jgi:excisionase family DNA binding protein